MIQQNNEAFEKWFESELQKLIDVKNYDDIHMLQINEHLAWKAWQAATQQSEREIAEFKAEIFESDFVIKQTTTLLAEICLMLKGEPPAKTLFGYHDLPKMVLELQASNNKLREALEFYANLDWKENTETWQLPAKQALASTPAQSLAEHDNEVIEICAKVCNESINTWHASRNIRALKGTL